MSLAQHLYSRGESVNYSTPSPASSFALDASMPGASAKHATAVGGGNLLAGMVSGNSPPSTPPDNKQAFVIDGKLAPPMKQQSRD